MAAPSEPAQPPRVRCRSIVDADAEAVVRLLVAGFPERTEWYWREGLERYRASARGGTGLGAVMLSGQTIVGVILTLYSERTLEGRQTTVCNLSSWYVEPAFRAYASLLEQFATRSKDVAYVNISAVRHTWPLLEQRGYRRYGRGEFVAVPLLSRAHAGVTIRRVSAGAEMRDLPQAEQRLLADHADYGCLCLIGTDREGSEPFVFLRRPSEFIRRSLGWSPFGYLQLIYCRSTADLVRFSHALGRHLLLQHATPFVMIDAVGPLRGIAGAYIDQWGSRFSRSRVPLPPGDLAYTELVLFGP